MLPENVPTLTNRPDEVAGGNVADAIRRAGRGLALAGVVLPLLLIGGLKFTQFEVEALKPVIGGTPWLAGCTPRSARPGPPTCSAWSSWRRRCS